MSEQERFLDWHQKEVANGLVDIKFCTGDLSDITSNKFYTEANQLNSAEGILASEYKDTVERVSVDSLFEKASAIV